MTTGAEVHDLLARARAWQGTATGTETRMPSEPDERRT